MSAEENEKFEMTDICWICGGLIEIIVISLENIGKQLIILVVST